MHSGYLSKKKDTLFCIENRFRNKKYQYICGNKTEEL